MKKSIVALAISIIGLLGYSFYLNQETTHIKAIQAKQERRIEAIRADQENRIGALNHLVHALEYKKNAQLYLLCSDPSQENLQLLADSCKADCVKYLKTK